MRRHGKSTVVRKSLSKFHCMRTALPMADSITKGPCRVLTVAQFEGPGLLAL